MNAVNLAIVPMTRHRGPISCGKVAQTSKGVWVLHSTVKESYRRVSIGGWGVRLPLIEYAEQHGIEVVMLYNTDANETYPTTVTTLRTYGTPGKEDDYGGTLNLPDMHWGETIKGRVPLTPLWIPNQSTVRLPPREPAMAGVSETIDQIGLFG